MSIGRRKTRYVQFENLVAESVPFFRGKPTEVPIEAVGSMGGVVRAAQEQPRMAQRLQMIDGQGQQLTAYTETFMAWKERKHRDFTRPGVAETVANQGTILGNESWQIALANS